MRAVENVLSGVQSVTIYGEPLSDRGSSGACFGH